MASSISGKLIVKKAQLATPTDISSLSTNLSLGELGLTYNSGATLGKLFVGSGNAAEFGVFMDSQVKAAGGSVATGEVSSIGYLGTSSTTAGYFNSSTTAPSSTTRLNYNGNLYANAFLSSSDLTVGTSSLSWTIDGTSNFVLKNSSGTARFTLTSAGDLSSLGAVTATSFSGSGSSLTSLTAGNLSGTIPSGVLGNSTLYVGTTAVALNRASASLDLTGVTNTNWDAAYTDTSNATSANTASRIVKRGSSGEFSAGTITTSRLEMGQTGYINFDTDSGQLASIQATTAGGIDVYVDQYFRVYESDASALALEFDANSSTITTDIKFSNQVEYTPSTLATTGTVNIDFLGASVRTQGDLTGNITYTGSNYGSGRNVTIRVKNGTTLRTLTFPSGWVFLGTKPANIAASKIGVLSLSVFGTAEADVVAAWAVQS